MKASPPPTPPVDRAALLQELHEIVAQAEKIFGATLEGCAEEKTSTAREELAQLVEKVRAKVNGEVKRADAAIRAHPYVGLAVALGVGALIGAVLARQLGSSSDPGSADESRP